MIYLRRLLLWLAMGPRAYQEMALDMKTSVGARGFVSSKTVRGQQVLVNDWRRTIYGIIGGRSFL